MKKIGYFGSPINIRYIKAKDIKGKIPTRYDDIESDIRLAKEADYFKQETLNNTKEIKTYNLGQKLAKDFEQLKILCHIS